MPVIFPLVLVILRVEVPFHAIPTKELSKVHGNSYQLEDGQEARRTAPSGEDEKG